MMPPKARVVHSFASMLSLDGFFFEQLFLSFPDDEDITIAEAVVHVLEKCLQVIAQGMNDIE